MAELTLLEAAKLEQPSYETGLIGTYAEAYPIHRVAPIVPSDRIYNWTIEGSVAYTGSSGSRLIGSDFTASKAEMCPYSSEVKAYGGKITVDRYVARNMAASIPAQEANQVKAFARKTFIDVLEGAGGADLRGVKDYIANDPNFNGQVVNASGSGQAAISLDMLDEALSLVQIVPGQTQIIANPIVIRGINKLMRGSVYYSENQEGGRYSPMYHGCELVSATDAYNANLLSTTEPDYATTATSLSCWIVTWGVDQVCFFSTSARKGANGAPMPIITKMNDGTNYEQRYFEFDIGLAVQQPRSVARIRYLANSMPS